MTSIRHHGSKILATASLVAALVLSPLGAQAAFAFPPPPEPNQETPSQSFATWCRTDLDGFAARLRLAGLGDQAAHNAYLITRKECHSSS
jgi:hypothetical protein